MAAELQLRIKNKELIIVECTVTQKLCFLLPTNFTVLAYYIYTYSHANFTFLILSLLMSDTSDIFV